MTQSRVITLLGIEIGGTKLQIVRGSADGQILERQRFVVDPAEGAEGIRARLADRLRLIRTQQPARAIGVGFGGPVDSGTGRIRCSHQIAGWADFPLRDWLRDRAGCPVTVENDADTAALGEALCGAGRGGNPVFYVTLGSGVGGGLVVDGRIYHGASPGQAEIGHVRLDRSGTTVESRCSGWAVDGKLRAWCDDEPASALALKIGPRKGGEARHLPDLLAAGDRRARELIEEVGGDLAFGLSHVVHLFHPDRLILGGGLSLIGEPLRESVERHLKGLVMDAFAPGPVVRLAALGEDAVPVGALRLAGATENALANGTAPGTIVH